MHQKAKLRIVVFDHDSSTVKRLAESIGRWRISSQVLTFTDPALAEQELEKIPPDLFVTDLYHGIPSGEEMLKRLSARRANFPVLVVRGAAKEEQVHRCATNGLKVGFRGTPCREEEFHSSLEELLNIPPRKLIPFPVPLSGEVVAGTNVNSQPSTRYVYVPPKERVRHRLEKYDL